MTESEFKSGPSGQTLSLKHFIDQVVSGSWQTCHALGSHFNSKRNPRHKVEDNSYKDEKKVESKDYKEKK